MSKIYSKRYIAQIKIQTTTPLAVSNGEKDSLTNSLVIRDVNGLPYIPGTSLSGIIRHSLTEETAKKLFGFNETRKDRRDRLRKNKKEKENIDEGSKMIISSAHIVDEYDNVIETLEDKEKNLAMSGSYYLQYFEKLPVRQHVRINNKGVSEEYGKFDEEVVFKGTRFCFEIEMLYGAKPPEGGKTDDDNEKLFKQVLCELRKDTLRIGSGSRNGFGEFEIIACVAQSFDLTNAQKREAYLNKTSSLNSKISVDKKEKTDRYMENDIWRTYELKLRPNDFFLFGSGFGDDEADAIPVTEGYFTWKGSTPVYHANTILIPGSSVKGALSHRVAYHYNRLTDVFCDEIETDILGKIKGRKRFF